MDGSYIWGNGNLTEEWNLGSGGVTMWKKIISYDWMFIVKYKANGSRKTWG